MRIIKKVLICLLLAANLLFIFNSFGFASQIQVRVYINGTEIEFSDSKPYIDPNGRTQIPLRAVGEALNAIVSWDQAGRTAKLELEGNTIELVINKKEYKLNGKVYQMDTAATLSNGRTYVPLRFVVTALGADLSWDGKTKSAYIEKKQQKKPGKVYIRAGESEYHSDYYVIAPKQDIPESMAGLYEGSFLIPIERLADIFGGSYSYDAGTKICTLILYGSRFEFKMYERTAAVNGEKKTLPYEVRIDRGVVRVPAVIFVGNVPGYDVKVFENRVVLFRDNSIYKENGDLRNRKKEIPFHSYRERLLGGLWEEDTRSDREKADRIASEIAASIANENMTDYEKVLAVNDYLVNNVDYDDSISSTMYDAFITRKVTCGGFEFAAGLLLEKMGIKSMQVVGFGTVDGHDDIDKYDLLGYSNQRHVWNIVYLNGNYYHLDTTFNQALSENNIQSYKYFLLSDEQMMEDHIWNFSEYPECKNEYEPDSVSKLSGKGYPAVSGTLKLGGKFDDDVYVRIRAYSQQAPRMISDRVIKVTGDTVPFSMIFDKKFANSDIRLRFSYLTQQPRLDLNVMETSSNISVSNNGSEYDVMIRPPELEKLNIKMVVPPDANVDRPYSFYIKVWLLNPTDGGYSTFGELYEEGTINPGETERTVEIKGSLPPGDFAYTVEYGFEQVFRGEEEVQVPFISEGYADGNGNYSKDRVTIDAGKYPLGKLSIKLVKNDRFKPEDKMDGLTDLKAGEIEAIKQMLRKFNCGNHSAIKSLKTYEDIVKLENAEPAETDSNGSCYYVYTMPNGVEIYRSYNLNQKMYSLYSISLNNIAITKDNYMALFDSMNEYLSSSLGQKAVNRPVIFSSDGAETSTMDRDELYSKIMKGYLLVYSSYEVDNYTYSITLSGNGSNNRLSISFRVYVS